MEKNRDTVKGKAREETTLLNKPLHTTDKSHSATVTEAAIRVLKISGAPGTGKTTALIAEAQRLLSTTDGEGLFPQQLQFILLSPHLQKNLEQRIEHTLTPHTHQSKIETIPITSFSSFCLQQLNKEAQHLEQETTRFKLLHKAQGTLLCRKWIDTHYQDTLPSDSTLLETIHQPAISKLFFDALCDTSIQHKMTESAGEETTDIDKLFRAVHQEFRAYSQAHGLITEPQLYSLTVNAYAQKSHSGLKSTGKLPVLLIDEAQELTQGQWEALQALLSCQSDNALGSKNVPQLILSGCNTLSLRESEHSFRRACPEYFKNPEQIFGKTAIITHYHEPYLTSVFRNNEPILHFSSQWLEASKQPSSNQNKTPSSETLWPSAHLEKELQNEPIQISEIKKAIHFGYTPTTNAEISLIIDKLKELKNETTCSWDNFAILFPQLPENNPLFQTLIRTCNENDIPTPYQAKTSTLSNVVQLLFHATSLIVRLSTNENSSQPISQQENRKLMQHFSQWLTLSGAQAPYEILQQSDKDIWSCLESYQHNAYIKRFTDTLKNHIRQFNTHPSLYELCWRLITEHQLLLELSSHKNTNHTNRISHNTFNITSPEEASGLSHFLKTLQDADHHLFTEKKPLVSEHSQRSLYSWLPVLWTSFGSSETLISTNPSTDCLFIGSIEQAQGKEFHTTFVPAMTRDLWPPSHTATRSKALDLSSQKTYKNERSPTPEGKAFIISALTRSRTSVFLSTHQQSLSDSDGKLEERQPSLLFLSLLSFYAKQTHLPELLNQINPKKHIPYGWLTQEKSASPKENSTLTADNSLSKKHFTSNTHWAKLEKQSQTTVLPAEQTLRLSHSHISNYMDCPKKYYYSNLIRLKQPSTKQSEYGSLTHRILELFIQDAIPAEPVALNASNEDSFNVKNLIQFINDLFDNRETPLTEQLTEYDRRITDNISEIERHDWRTKLINSAEDLENKGFFKSKPDQSLLEIAFEYTHPEIPHCRFNGKIDALFKRDNQWTILDFKTSKGDLTKEKNTEKRRSALLNRFSELPEEASPNNLKRFEKPEKRSYQLPLYFLATQHDTNLRTQLAETSVQEVGLQFIREALPNKNGAIQVALTSKELTESTQHVIQDLNTHIVSPIRESAEFLTNPGNACKYCGFTKICDAQELEDSSDDE